MNVLLKLPNPSPSLKLLRLAPALVKACVPIHYPTRVQTNFFSGSATRCFGRQDVVLPFLDKTDPKALERSQAEFIRSPSFKRLIKKYPTLKQYINSPPVFPTPFEAYIGEFMVDDYIGDASTDLATKIVEDQLGPLSHGNEQEDEYLREEKYERLFRDEVLSVIGMLDDGLRLGCFRPLKHSLPPRPNCDLEK